MIQAIERSIKAAIVDRAHYVSSAALVGAYHFYQIPSAKEVIKRWSNEIQEAAQAKSPSGLASFMGSNANQNSSYIVQYHALGLLYAIRHQDRMAITKIVQGFGKSSSMSTGGNLKSPLAICLVIRFACKVLDNDPKYGF